MHASISSNNWFRTPFTNVVHKRFRTALSNLHATKCADFAEK